MPDPFISAVMIVRNEAARLGRCLESIADLVDEVCVVDTGSDDDTIAIARSHGAKVIESPWQADFSLHRNEAFDMASGEWLLIIDGDEELHEGCAEALRTAVEDINAKPPGYSAILVPVETRGDGGLRQQFLAQRIVRRGAYRYAYPVHNQLIPLCQRPSEIAVQCGMIVSHYTGQMQAKADRSLPMLFALYDSNEAEMWARYGIDKPDDVPSHKAHSAFFIAKTYAAVSDHAAVLDWGRRAEVYCRDRPNFAELWCWIYYARLAEMARTSGSIADNHYVEAVAVLNRGLALHPDFVDLHRADAARALLGMMRSSRTPAGQAYARCSAAGLQAVSGIPAASAALGIPIVWRGGETKGGVRGELPVKAEPDAAPAPF